MIYNTEVIYYTKKLICIAKTELVLDLKPLTFSSSVSSPAGNEQAKAKTPLLDEMGTQRQIMEQ
jgi:hypothetical protein